MNVTRILHSSVNTAAVLEPAIAFYRDVLGLDDERRPEIPGVPGHWFRVGDAQVHLVGRAEADSGIDPSAHHVCVGVEDLEAAVRELEQAGVPFVRGAQRHPDRDVQQVFLTDPAGNTIELQEDR